MIFKKSKRIKEEQKKQQILNFQSPNYQQINVARLQHLTSLNINFTGKHILELGAGIGDHTFFYLVNNAKVTPIEGRKELVEYISTRFGIEAIEQDLEKDFVSNLKREHKYDIAHCYGILYHLANPEKFIKSVAELTDCILLETCVSYDDNLIGTNLVGEDKEDSTQAISGTGCRPNRKWIFNKIKENYKYSYMPITQPKHIQFPNYFDREAKDTELVRAIFIGSNSPIDSDKLVNEFVEEYHEW